MTETDDERELRKWALSHTLTRAANAEQACRDAEVLVRYVETGETRKPMLAEVMPG